MTDYERSDYIIRLKFYVKKKFPNYFKTLEQNQGKNKTQFAFELLQDENISGYEDSIIEEVLGISWNSINKFKKMFGNVEKNY